MPKTHRRRNVLRRKRNRTSGRKVTTRQTKINKTVKYTKGSGTSSTSTSGSGSGTSSNPTNNNARKNQNVKKVPCAPRRKDLTDKTQLDKFTCYSKPSLLKMRDLWNLRHRDKPITTNDPKEIWHRLKEALSSACEAESCWLNQEFIKNNLDNELLDYTFAPKSPPKWKEDHTTWLNSLDIEKVMKQYEHTYPEFRFIGPTPIDFDKRISDNTCVWNDLCNFDLVKFKNKKVTKIGIIFNTDPHTKGGAHWIAMFINITAGFIFFFDSNGFEETKEIKKFVDRILTQAAKMNPPLKLDFINNKSFRHQEGNTECGMYSLFFIISLLTETKKYSFFKTTKITDKDMEHLRDVYYNSV